MGRPRKKLRPADYEQVKALAASGYSQAQIARAIRIDTKTLRERFKDDPAAAQAYADGKFEEGKLVRLLIETAEGKRKDGNVTAMIFLLKARHGYRDQGPADVGTEDRPLVNINIPQPVARGLCPTRDRGRACAGHRGALILMATAALASSVSPISLTGFQTGVMAAPEDCHQAHTQP